MPLLDLYIAAPYLLPGEHYTTAIIGTNNYDDNLVHMPGTHFAAGWTCGLFLSVPKAGLKLDCKVTNHMLYQM